MSDWGDPQWGGVRCPGCGGEVFPYTAATGEMGVHFMDCSISVAVTTLEKELVFDISGDEGKPLCTELRQRREMLVKLIAIIDQTIKDQERVDI